MTTTHLITGVGGQDGVLLARLLSAKGHRVIGTLSPLSSRERLVYLGGISIEPLDIRDKVSFERLLTAARPDVVHNLAAFTSVGDSWDDEETVHQVNHHAVRGMLEVILQLGSRAPRFIHASSSEIFGRAEGSTRIDERTPLSPVSPYADAKAGAHRAVQDARAAGAVTTNLILFGHTSPLHPARFAIPTLTSQAAEVARGSRGAISLRDPGIQRDWGSAHDFVRAFARAAICEAGDYVIATGVLHSLSELCDWALHAAGVTQEKLFIVDTPPRPHDFDNVPGDSHLAQEELNWLPRTTLHDEVVRMVRVAQRRVESGISEDPNYLDFSSPSLPKKV